ncbi:MAG: TolC family protein [Saprospiraceae bacterium]|nr:TolC family protein [Saprospiraceae bacterium]
MYSLLFNHRAYLVFLLVNLSISKTTGQDNDNAVPLTTITLAQCYDWSKNNYPLVAQLDLLAKSTQYSLSNASKGTLPQININGQATYQSEVTELAIDIPNTEIPTVDKDQYNIYAEVYQPLTNFANIRSQKNQIDLNGKMEMQQVEIDLYQLQDRVNQIYFSILLMDARNGQLSLMEQDIDSTLARLEAAVTNGTSTLMDQKLLEVEKIKIEQQIQENGSNRAAFLRMLSQLTGQTIGKTTTLIQPVNASETWTLNRPELRLFDLREQLLNVQDAQLNNRYIPDVGLFFQGGYGRPALNFLSNEFSTYYITGLKLNWNLSSLYKTKNDRQNLAIQRQLINTEKETFLLNNEITQSQQSAEIVKFNDLIAGDEKAVALREEIKTIAEVQLLNGLITTIDYIKILNDASRAKQDLELHETMLLQAQYNLKTTTGN